jgi:cytochrome bd-type quinol oxidase subunit 1
MELTSFYELMFNPVAQAKFVHGAASFSLASALSVVVLGAGQGACRGSPAAVGK